MPTESAFFYGVSLVSDWIYKFYRSQDIKNDYDYVDLFEIWGKYSDKFPNIGFRSFGDESFSEEYAGYSIYIKDSLRCTDICDTIPEINEDVELSWSSQLLEAMETCEEFVDGWESANPGWRYGVVV